MSIVISNPNLNIPTILNSQTNPFTNAVSSVSSSFAVIPNGSYNVEKSITVPTPNTPPTPATPAVNTPIKTGLPAGENVVFSSGQNSTTTETAASHATNVKVLAPVFKNPG